MLPNMHWEIDDNSYVVVDDVMFQSAVNNVAVMLLSHDLSKNKICDVRGTYAARSAAP